MESTSASTQLEEGVATGRGRTVLLWFCVWACVGLVLLTVAELLAIVLQGEVRGREFSVEDFSRRDFVYWSAPWFDILLTPVVRRTYRTEVENMLVDNRWISVQPAQRWEVLDGKWGSESVAPQPVAILGNYLELRWPDRTSYWVAWSNAHRVEASILWPVVALVARSGWYEFLPDLFVAARRSVGSSADDFRRALAQAIERQADLLRPGLSSEEQKKLQELRINVLKLLSQEQAEPGLH